MGSTSRQIGEWDIKDDPKLPAYCGCFGQKFADRAVTKTQPAQSKAEAQALQAEELDMRNGCRKQLGLPAVPPKNTTR